MILLTDLEKNRVLNEPISFEEIVIFIIINKLLLLLLLLATGCLFCFV